MPHATWSGFVSFGLVTIPVEMHRATAVQTVHFNQLRAGTSHRIRYRKVDEVSGDEVAADDIVNGYATGDGEYVVVTKDELRASAPARSTSIEIRDFVDLGEIDPIHFDQSYYLRPRGHGTERAYALLTQALRATGKVGIATFVMRDTEHLVAIRADSRVLVAETMFFADEIRSIDEIGLAPQDDRAFDERELDAAVDLVSALSTTWDPTRYENTYRAQVLELIENKRRGHAVVQESEAPESNVVDLLTALQQSIPEARGSTPRAKTPRRRRAPSGRAKRSA